MRVRKLFGALFLTQYDSAGGKGGKICNFYILPESRATKCARKRGLRCYQLTRNAAVFEFCWRWGLRFRSHATNVRHRISQPLVGGFEIETPQIDARVLARNCHLLEALKAGASLLWSDRQHATSLNRQQR